MKILDKTPLQDEKGNISIVARVQGTLKYGLNWYAELEAQKLVIAQLDRILEKSFVLIRNFPLPNSEIVIPLILVGTSGVFVIFVTQVKGHFEAKGDQWNTVTENGASVPARRNLVDLTEKLTKVFQKYLENQKINLKVPVEPVLIASDPGAQIESTRPNVRVVRSDGIRTFANSLLQAQPVLRPESIYSLADRIVSPRSLEELLTAPHTEVGGQADRPVSRAQAIFNATDPSRQFNPDELGFSEETPEGAAASAVQEPVPARPRTRSAPAQKRTLGMTNTQLFMLVGMFVLECCVVIGFGIFYLSTQ